MLNIYQHHHHHHQSSLPPTPPTTSLHRFHHYHPHYHHKHTSHHFYPRHHHRCMLSQRRQRHYSNPWRTLWQDDGVIFKVQVPAYQSPSQQPPAYSLFLFSPSACLFPCFPVFLALTHTCSLYLCSNLPHTKFSYQWSFFLRLSYFLSLSQVSVNTQERTW